MGQAICSVSHLQGDFLLQSGRRASQYFDKYQFESDPDLLRSVAKGLAPLVPDDIEVLAGLELGGVPIATALSLATSLPVAFVREAAMEYGTAKLAEGAVIAGRRVLVVEDVITSGGQVVASTPELGSLGSGNDWWVFTAGDDFPQRVRMPEGFRPLDIGESWVIGIWTDDLDVEHVRLYPLSRSDTR